MRRVGSSCDKRAADHQETPRAGTKYLRAVAEALNVALHTARGRRRWQVQTVANVCEGVRTGGLVEAAG